MKKLMSFTLLLTAFLTLAACSGSDEPEAVKDEGTELTETIRFGLMSSIDAIPFVIAEENGIFKEYGVNVEIQTFSSARDRDAAFQAGELDGIIGDLIAVGLYNEGGFDVKITGSTTGSFSLLSNGDMTSLEDLKGKKVIISSNTAIEYTLDTMLASVGLTEDDIEKEEVPAIPTRLELLRNNQSDAALLPEPFVTIGVADGLNAITDTGEQNIDPFITAFTQDAINNKSAEIKAFYQAYNAAVEYLNSTDIEEYIDFIIEKVGFPEELRESIDLPEFRLNSLPTDEDINSALEWLRNKDLVTQDFEPSDLVSNIAFQ